MSEKEGKIKKSIRCKLGIHKYGKWNTFIGSAILMMIVAPNFYKKCELCEKVKFR